MEKSDQRAPILLPRTGYVYTNTTTIEVPKMFRPGKLFSHVDQKILDDFDPCSHGSSQSFQPYDVVEKQRECTIVDYAAHKGFFTISTLSDIYQISCLFRHLLKENFGNFFFVSNKLLETKQIVLFSGKKGIKVTYHDMLADLSWPSGRRVFLKPGKLSRQSPLFQHQTLGSICRN